LPQYRDPHRPKARPAILKSRRGSRVEVVQSKRRRRRRRRCRNDERFTSSLKKKRREVLRRGEVEEERVWKMEG
jgi:hypothetical protein